MRPECQFIPVFPLGHLAVAYLLYVGYAVPASHRLPARWALISLFVASQVPDLVDKPLAYYGVLANGRAFAHSLFTFAVVSVLVWLVARRLLANQPEGSWRYHLVRLVPVSFAVGYVSHLIADAHRALLAGNYFGARWLLWPIYRLPPGQTDLVAPWIRLLDLSNNLGSSTQRRAILAALVVFGVIRLIALKRGEPIETGGYAT